MVDQTRFYRWAAAVALAFLLGGGVLLDLGASYTGVTLLALGTLAVIWLAQEGEE